MPWGMGRGFRWMYYATGMPGWVRAGFEYPAFGRGNPFPFCRWFPWLPRWWWTGAYGPVLASQTSVQFQPQMTKEQEIQYLEQELQALEEEKKALEQDLESIRKRINELKS